MRSLRAAILKRVRHRRVLVTGLLLAGVCFILGFLVSHEIPRLRSFALVKIEELSRDHLPVRILPGRIDITFFPLGATVTKVRILPKPEISDVFERASIDRFSVSVSPWLLLSGRIRLAEVSVEGAEVEASLPKSERKSDAPLQGLFDTVAKIPLNRLRLSDVWLNLRMQDPKAILNVSDLNLTLEKRLGGSLYLGLESVSAKVTDLESKTAVRMGGEGHLTVARKGIDISDLRIRRGDSFASIHGELTGDVEKLKFETLDVEAETELHLESMRNWAVRHFKDLRDLPPLKGRAVAQGTVKKTGSAPAQADFKFRAEDLGMSKMQFGNVRAEGKFANNEVKIPRLEIENPSGLIQLNQISVNTISPYAMSAVLNAEGLHLHELLKALGVGQIPVWLQVSGDVPCAGKFQPFSIECKGSLAAENLLVRDNMKTKSTLVALRKVEAKGDVMIDAEKVSYHATLSAPNSKGQSEGEISYDEGFKISYETDHLEIKDVANLADLKLEGHAKIKGTTQGDSNAATLSLEVEGSDIWFEDFWLGQPKAVVGYKSGVLSFDHVSGYYTVSRYAGDVKLDFPTQQISVNGRIPFFDARDLLKVFSRKVKLPFPVTGTGQAAVQASGPLDFSRLSYDLKSSLFKGSVMNEVFDQAHFDVKSVKGEVKAERIDVTKGSSTIHLTGTGHPDGTIKTRVIGNGIRIEDSHSISQSGFSLAGALDFDMKMEGPVLSPNTDMTAKLTGTSIGDQGVPDSEFALKLRSSGIEGTGNLVGGVVKTEFVVPFEAASPFSLKLQTLDWNFAPFFSAIAGTSARKDYEGRLTSAIELKSASGGFWNSSGQVKIDKFSLARGSLALASTEPIRMQMTNGQLHVDKFDLAGENIYLRISDSANQVNKIDLQVNGKVDMTLVAIFTPFLEDLRGLLSFTFNLRSGPTTTELLGSAYLTKAFVKFFGFPHPLENIQADLLFNQRKILINTIKAELGGGRVAGTGGLELKGYKNYPVNVAGTFEKVTFNVPDKVSTTGSGTLSFTGNWFPFVLKADYDVREGIATKELAGDTSAESDGIRRDYFLPENLVAENFTPVLLDLNVAFNRGISVKNELVDGRVLGNLSVKGKPSKPSILGNISTARETYIIVKDTPFEVTSSSIQFTDPNELNPKLYIAARARKNEYDITLIIQGTAAKPDLQFTSVPPLPEKDITSLLVIGATDTQLANTNVTRPNNAQGSSSPLAAGPGVIKKNPVSNLIKDSIGFDVQFSPGFDETGSSAVQKIVVSRQFNPRFDVTASRSVGGKFQETQARARYRLNERISAIGSWLGRDYSESATTTNTQSTVQNPNAFGLDLEYKFEFK